MKKLYCILLIGAIIFSCKKKEPEPTNTNNNNGGSVNIEDPNQVASAIKIRNATVKDGTPPAPSTDPAAPIISDPSNPNPNEPSPPLKSFGGKNAVLMIDLDQGDVAGYYLQVNGANTYFDISRQTARIGAKKSKIHQLKRTADDELYIAIELPENIRPGTFCVSYCVYDAQNRVSNIIERCIEVVQMGGAGTEWLTGSGSKTWTMTKIAYTDEDGVTEVDTINTTSTYTHEAYVACPESEDGYENVEITESFRSEYIDLVFNRNGALRIKEKYHSTILDYSATSCDNVVYEDKV
ncbi:MAG: hypothetical protein ACK4ND_16750, partial [Cytophagaceae bacterium]